MTQEKLEQLKATAAEVRRGILTEVHAANSGHPGGSLSVADIITYLYSEVLRVDPENPRWEDRDRLVLSKGHTCPALYAMLAEKGFFPKEELTTFRAIGSRLQGHPDMNKAPGIDFSAGSLGQGVSAACGMALAGKIGNKDSRVYTILGDGEIEEGQVWEAAMFADHYSWITCALSSIITICRSTGGSARFPLPIPSMRNSVHSALRYSAATVMTLTPWRRPSKR